MSTIARRIRMLTRCRRGHHRDHWSARVTATSVEWEKHYAISQVRCLARCADCSRSAAPVLVVSWAPMESLLPPGLQCPKCQLVHNLEVRCP